MSLAKRHAVVTGSTSGIGLAIARALAKEGANVMINGFGDAGRRSRRSASGIEKEFGVKASTTAPTCRRAGRRGADRRRHRQDRRRRHPGQQRRHPVRLADRGFPAREMGPDHRHQPLVRLPHHRAAIPGMKAQEMGPHHQHRLRPFARRLAVQVGLCRGQAWPRRPHQDGRAGTRDLRRHRQLHLARLCLDAAGREPDPRHDEGAQHDARAGHQRRAAGRPADQAVRHRRAGRRARRLSLLGRRRRRSPAPISRSTAAGRRRERGPAAAKPGRVKTVNLALQGGGSHGAYTWGVLDAFSRMRASRSARSAAPAPAR